MKINDEWDVEEFEFNGEFIPFMKLKEIGTVGYHKNKIEIYFYEIDLNDELHKFLIERAINLTQESFIKLRDEKYIFTGCVNMPETVIAPTGYLMIKLPIELIKKENIKNYNVNKIFGGDF